MRPFATVWSALVPAATSYLLLTVAAAVFAVIVRSRRFTVVPALFVSIVDAVLLYSLFLVGYLVAAPQPAMSEVAVRLVPGADLGVALQAAPGDLLPWLQLAGNLLLLAPFGALVPVRVSWFGGWGRISLGALTVTCGIEFLQYAVLTGRVVSADDVLLNATGALLGALVTRPWWGRLPQTLTAARPRTRPRHALRPQYARSAA